MSSSNSLKTKPSPSGPTVLGVPLYTLGGDKMKIRDYDYELTRKIYEALSFTGYTGKTRENEDDNLMINKIVDDLGYTGVGDRDSKRKTFLTITLPNLVDEIQNKTFDEIDLEGHGVKNFIPSTINNNYTRLEILLGLELSGHTDTLTEASNLIDELFKRGELQNKQQYRNALNKFSTPKMERPSELLEQIAFNTRPEIEDIMLIVMDKFTHEENVSQPLQTNIEQIKTAVTFLTGYNGIFNVTNTNKKFYFIKLGTDKDGYIQMVLTKLKV